MAAIATPLDKKFNFTMHPFFFQEQQLRIVFSRDNTVTNFFGPDNFACLFSYLFWQMDRTLHFFAFSIIMGYVGAYNFISIGVNNEICSSFQQNFFVKAIGDQALWVE